MLTSQVVHHAFLLKSNHALKYGEKNNVTCRNFIAQLPCVWWHTESDTILQSNCPSDGTLMFAVTPPASPLGTCSSPAPCWRGRAEQRWIDFAQCSCLPLPGGDQVAKRKTVTQHIRTYAHNTNCLHKSKNVQQRMQHRLPAEASVSSRLSVSQPSWGKPAADC